MRKTEGNAAKISATLMYFVMLFMNMSAALFPITGLKTQDVSAKYETLFAPAGLTFSIWSVIYLLLALFLIYQWFSKDSSGVLADQRLMKGLNTWFLASSILNIVWLLTWQYEWLKTSVVLMFGLLASLIYINHLLKKISLTKKEYVCIRLPFSVYFGWITVATIANVSSMLVKENIPLFMNDPVFWTIAILLVGVVIAGATIVDNHDIAYGVTVLWAYLGILMKHEAADGWNQAYPTIITTTIVCLVLLIIACLFVAIRNLRKRRRAFV